MTNVNQGHRDRLRQRMMREGLQNFQDHEVLELLLFQYLPRKDTNKIAHDLLNQFGNFAGVMNATPSQLMMVKGISETTACNLAVLKEVWQRYKNSEAQRTSLSSLASIIKYTQKIISDSYVEKMVVVYVDNATNFLASEEFCSESVDKVDMDVKKIVKSALQAGAAGVILFHCHVHGVCEPSDADISFTERTYMTLANMNMVLLDHVIFNNTDNYYSFFKAGKLEKLAEKYKDLHNKK